MFTLKLCFIYECLCQSHDCIQGNPQRSVSSQNEEGKSSASVMLICWSCRILATYPKMLSNEVAPVVLSGHEESVCLKRFSFMSEFHLSWISLMLLWQNKISVVLGILIFSFKTTVFVQTILEITFFFFFLGWGNRWHQSEDPDNLIHFYCISSVSKIRSLLVSNTMLLWKEGNTLRPFQDLMRNLKKSLTKSKFLT